MALNPAKATPITSSEAIGKVAPVPEKSGHTRLDGLQALRAIAAASVIFTHLYYHYNGFFLDSSRYVVFERGFLGVQLFFVISGFIIAYIHFNDVGKRDQAQSYFAKRIIRIAPLCWLMIAINFVWFIGLYATQVGFMQAVLHPEPFGYLDFILNLLFVAPTKILGPTWTLTYEMVFYLWFGLSLVFGRAWLMITGWLWLALILVARAKHWAPHAYLPSILMDSRCAMFLLGVTIAWILRTQKIKWLGWPFALVGVILYALTFTLPPGDSSLRFTVLEVGGCGLMVFGAALPWGFTLPGWVRYLGDASYSTYLGHTAAILLVYQTITLFTGRHTIDLPLWACFVCWLVVLLLTLPLYQFVEKPLTEWVRQRASWAIKKPQPQA